MFTSNLDILKLIAFNVDCSDAKVATGAFQAWLLGVDVGEEEKEEEKAVALDKALGLLVISALGCDKAVTMEFNLFNFCEDGSCLLSRPVFSLLLTSFKELDVAGLEAYCAYLRSASACK